VGSDGVGGGGVIQRRAPSNSCAHW
jgi:hypothetical protein